MSKKLVTKIAFLSIAVFFAIFLLSKPYNQMCRAVNWCHPVSISYLLPSFEGEKSLKINFAAQSEVENVDFRVNSQNSVNLQSGAKHSAIFTIINRSDKDFTLRPVRFFENGKLAQYINFYECLCFQSYKVKAGTSLDLAMRIKLKHNIDKAQVQSGEKITIGYRLIDE